jgi:heme exporter protein A
MPQIESVSRYGKDVSPTAAQTAADGMRLVASELVCHRGGREIFAGLSFSVTGGQALIVSGPNGAGKTSLLRIVAGLLDPAGGRIEVCNGRADSTIAEQAHYLAHRDALKPSLSVMENLRFWAEYLGGGGAPAAAALAAVDLDALADLPAGYLSAGQRRRLSLARLLAVQRPIWLLDEPTAALDVAGEARLGEFMHTHLAGGGIIVAATHAPLRLEPMQELKLGKPA